MNFLEGLNEEQARAVASRENLVCSAGAGAGKTRVITHRYLHLLAGGDAAGRITQTNSPETGGAPGPGNILALTFTRAAAREMKSRIYAAVVKARHLSTAVERAYQNFDSAVITTIDAFCNQIAAAGGGRYGIATTLRIDEQRLGQLVQAEIQDFLARLDAEGQRLFALAAGAFGLEAIVTKLLRPIAIRAAGFTDQTPSISATLAEDRSWSENLARQMLADTLEVLVRLHELLTETEGQRRLGKKGPSKMLDAALDWLAGALRACGLDTGSDALHVGAAVEPLFAKLQAGAEILPPDRPTKPTQVLPVEDREELNTLWETLNENTNRFPEISSFLRALDDCTALAQLLENFRLRMIQVKRTSGLVDYQDLIQLAIRVLQDDQLLADHYRRKFRAIMIDEFQDNNQIQKTLLYLLAVPPGWRGQAAEPAAEQAAEQAAEPVQTPQIASGTYVSNSGAPDKHSPQQAPAQPRSLVPTAADLEPGKLFFVGDQKQSIYLFRGADVRVFRNLASELAAAGSTGNLPLSTNYRSHPRLIQSWNRMFARIFSPQSPVNKNIPAEFLVDFEPIEPRSTTDPAEPNPRLELWLQRPLEEDGKAQPAAFRRLLEYRAAARRIRELLDSREPIWDRDLRQTRPVRASDFGILLRTGTGQMDLEQILLSHGIPFTVQTGRSLFLDALAADFTKVFSLLVHPGMQNLEAWAAVARSPFLNLTSDGLVELLDHIRQLGDLESVGALSGSGDSPSTPPPAFSCETDASKFQRFLGLLNHLSGLVDRKPHDILCAELWARYGYRDFVLDRANPAPFLEQYRQFESFAASNRELPFHTFVSDLEKRLGHYEKVEDLVDIPPATDSVRIMTIHSSKGLEFPFVFFLDIAAGNRDHGEGSEPAAFAANEAGYPVVRLNHNLVTGSRGRGLRPSLEAERRKAAEAAELQRLFYVACTRAESGLFLFVSPAKGNDKTGFSAILRAGLAVDDLFTLPENAEVDPGFLVRTIEGLSPDEYEAERRNLGKALRGGGSKRPGASEYKPLSWPTSTRLRNPSSHHDEKGEGTTASGEQTQAPTLSQEAALLLGSLAHAAIELRLARMWPEKRLLAGRDNPADWAVEKLALERKFEGELARGDFAKLPEAATRMAAGFFASSWFTDVVLPKQPAFESELAYVEWEGEGWVRGTVDLVLFFEDGERWVVDFKTDRNLDPQVYTGQLADYARAVRNLQLAGHAPAAGLPRTFIVSLQNFEASELAQG